MKKFFVFLPSLVISACHGPSSNSSLKDNEIRPNSLLTTADLGQGYFPEKESFGTRCISFTTRDLDFSEQECKIEYAVSASEIQESLGFSGSAKGRSGITKGSATASFARKSISDEKEMGLVAYCKMTTKPQAIDETSIKIIGDKRDWPTRCGSEVVYQKARGASVFLSVKMKFASDSERERFKSEIGASFANFGSIKTSLEKAKSSFSNSAVIEIQGLQLGGEVGSLGRALGGLTAERSSEKAELSSITTCSITNPAACENVINNFLAYAGSSTNQGFGYQAKNYPADLAYVTKPWNQLPYVPRTSSREIESLFATKRNLLDQKFDQHLRDLITVERIKRLVNNHSDQLLVIQSQLQKNERLIYDAIKACWDDYEPNNRDSELKCIEKSNLDGLVRINTDFLTQETAPERSLSSFHDGCNAPDKAKTPECISASYRYCKSNGYNIGLPQYRTAYEIGVSCLRGADRHDVSYETLRSFHSDCHGAYSAECVAATHRYCSSIGQGAGIGQELGDGVVGVACFTPSLYTDVSHQQLAEFDAGCRPNESHSLSCTTAAHRWCSTKGYASGLIQEVGLGAYGVACTNAKLQTVRIN